MADTEHDIAVLVAEQQREREGITAANTNVIGADTNSLAEPTAECYVTQAERRTHPLRTEGDWQQAERVIVLLADELHEATECGRKRRWVHEYSRCPAADYCAFHHPDSLPCEDATCPAVIAAWAREKEDK